MATKSSKLKAIVRVAQPVDAVISLSREEKAAVAEALRRAEATRNVIEDALVDFGRWLLVHVFEDDAASALEPRKSNPVWLELARRAGGPTLGLSQKFLYTALALAAHDKRISDQAWRLLEPGRKQLLLPLGDETVMRKAAQHVVAMKLSQRATQKYVRELQQARGVATQLRVNPSHFALQMRKFREGMSDRQKKFQQALRSASAGDRKIVRQELVALRDWAAEVLRATK